MQQAGRKLREPGPIVVYLLTFYQREACSRQEGSPGKPGPKVVYLLTFYQKEACSRQEWGSGSLGQ